MLFNCILAPREHSNKKMWLKQRLLSRTREVIVLFNILTAGVQRMKNSMECAVCCYCLESRNSLTGTQKPVMGNEVLRFITSDVTEQLAKQTHIKLADITWIQGSEETQKKDFRYHEEHWHSSRNPAMCGRNGAKGSVKALFIFRNCNTSGIIKMSYLRNSAPLINLA